jgi:hypothetical protein
MYCKARQGNSRKDKGRKGKARQGKATLGDERERKAMSCNVR